MALINLTPPPASVRVNSDARAMCTVELEPHVRAADDCELQKMLNLCLFHSLDSCLPLRPLDPPVNSELLACVQTSASPHAMLPLTGLDSSINFLSFNKCQRESHQVAAVFPGVPDMFLTHVPEHNSQEACLLHGQSAAPEFRPDGGDVHHSSLALCPSYSHEELTTRSHTQINATQPTMACEGLAAMACPLPASVQPGTDMLNLDQMEFKAGLEEGVKEQLSKHEELKDKAWKLQKRLQVLLGDHVLLHCSQQLEGLKSCQFEDMTLNSLDSVYHESPPKPCINADLFGQESATVWPSFMEVSEFCDSSQMVLRDLLEVLDSEATDSSSSDDDEPEEDMVHGKISLVSSCERQWLEERAELSSRWSWLQLRLSELEGRTEQLVELHQNICSTKGRVVLADPHPQTGRQIQQTLMRGKAGLSCTASEADTEPCSPTRLLHNIERQIAQLSQFVNSLGFSPLSKQDQTWRGRKTFTSGQGGGDGFLSGSFKSRRRRMGSRQLFKADVSCVCARTRPLVSYHKRRLFTFKSFNTTSSLKSRKSMSAVSSSFSSSCSCGSCDPEVLSSDPDCRSSSRTPPLVPFSSDFSINHLVQGAVAREEWLQIPLVINSQLTSPANYKRNSSTPRHSSYKYKQRAPHHKRRVMGLSPIRSSGSAWNHRSRSKQRRRKRGRSHRLIDDDQEVPYQLCDGESSDDAFEETCTQITHSQSSRGFVRKHQRGGAYNINNIILPASLSKVEKLQYKNILTPSWRVADTEFLTEMEAEKVKNNKKWQTEDLCDDVFAQRHLPMEQKEKSRWSSWGKRTCCRRPLRSVSRLSGSGSRMYTSGEESSAEWNCAQLDSDEQIGSEEWLPQAPWEPRLFPLDDVEEASLLSEAEVPSLWRETSSVSYSSKHSSTPSVSL